LYRKQPTKYENYAFSLLRAICFEKLTEVIYSEFFNKVAITRIRRWHVSVSGILTIFNVSISKYVDW